MAKKKLASEVVMEATVDELRQEHKAMIAQRMRCPGDAERAMYQLESEFGLPYWSQWNLQNKREREPPKAFVQRLRLSILLMCQTSVKRSLSRLKGEAERGNVAPDLENFLAEASALHAEIQAAKERVKA